MKIEDLEIDKISVLNIKKSDTLVVKIKDLKSMKSIDSAYEFVKSRLGIKNKMLLMDAEDDMFILKEDK